MNDLNFIALSAEPSNHIRFHRSLALELAIKNRQRMKKQVWAQARKKGLLPSAKPVPLV